MTTFVKICGLTEPETVRAAVAAGADAIGFVFFAGSPRNVTPEQAARLATNVPASVRRVAVMLHPESALWDEVSDALRPDALQTDSDDFASLNIVDSVARWPVFREGSVLANDVPRTPFVYEGMHSGQGQTVDWDAAEVMARRGKMILAGGLTIDNVSDAIHKVAPFGVDVSSAVESEPGKKDVELIAAFVAAAKAAPQNRSEGNMT
jgi:phosphoribosylanthranilate isomerase